MATTSIIGIKVSDAEISEGFREAKISVAVPSGKPIMSSIIETAERLGRLQGVEGLYAHIVYGDTSSDPLSRDDLHEIRQIDEDYLDCERSLVLRVLKDTSAVARPIVSSTALEAYIESLSLAALLVEVEALTTSACRLLYLVDSTDHSMATSFASVASALCYKIPPARSDESAVFEARGRLVNWQFGKSQVSPRHIRVHESAWDSVATRLRRCCAALSLAHIVDYAHLNASEIEFSVRGIKHISWKVHFDELTDDSVDTLFNLFDWVYSDPLQIAKRVPIARNALTLSCPSGKLDDVREDVVSTAEAALQMSYVQDAKDVLDTITKLNDSALGIMDKCMTLRGQMLQSLKQNILSFVGLVVGLLVYRILARSQGIAFPTELILLIGGLLIGSGIYAGWLYQTTDREFSALKNLLSSFIKSYSRVLSEKTVFQLSSVETALSELTSAHTSAKQLRDGWIVSLFVLAGCMILVHFW